MPDAGEGCQKEDCPCDRLGPPPPLGRSVHHSLLHLPTSSGAKTPKHHLGRKGGRGARRGKKGVVIKLTRQTPPMLLLFLLLLLVKSATGVDMFGSSSGSNTFFDGDGGVNVPSLPAFNTTSSFISHGPLGPPPPAPFSPYGRRSSSSSSSIGARHQGRLTPAELRRLWRSAGCEQDEITLKCVRNDIRISW